MLIACPKCATSYEVESRSLAPAGRSVRCVRCQHVWFATSTDAMAEIARTYRAEVGAMSGAGAAATTEPAPVEEPQVWSEPPMQPSDPAPPEPVPAMAEVPAGEVSLAPPPIPQPPPSEEVVPPAPPVDVAATAAPSADPPGAGPRGAASRAGEDIETVARRRAQLEAKRRRRRVPGLATAILALVALDTALLAWRADVVRLLPQTAAVYAAVHLPVNLRGLSFADVKTLREDQDGVQVLVVEGLIVSAGKRPVELPRLRFAVRNDAGQEIYAWTALPSRKLLLAGQALPFRSRLASPPPEGTQVLVRFFNRRDLVAGNL